MSDARTPATRGERWGLAQLWPLGALVALVLVVLLPSTGVAGAVRAGAAGILLVLVPGFVLARLTDRTGDWVERLFAACVLSVGAYALFGFVAYELSYRWTRGLMVTIAVVVAALVLLVPTKPPVRRVRTQLGVIALAACLSIGVAAGAIVTHQLLPAAPVEAAFSLTATSAVVSGDMVTVSVSVDSVGGASPRSLTLSADGNVLTRVPVTATTRTVTLRALVHSSHLVSCSSRIVVAAANGAFLSPVIACSDEHAP